MFCFTAIWNYYYNFLFGVLIVELIQGYSFRRVVKVSIGSIVAFLAKQYSQAIIMFIMIVWFFIDALLIN